jgi:hypothetical protein
VIGRGVAAVALSLTATAAVAAAVPTLRGTRHWEGPIRCVTREPYRPGVGWVDAQVCLSTDVFTQWDGAFIGGAETAQTDVLASVREWRWVDGRWVRLRPRHASITVTEVSGDATDSNRDACRVACPLNGLRRGAVLFHVERIYLAADCNTYHWRGTATVTLDGIFDGFHIDVPAVGAVAAQVCSP